MIDEKAGWCLNCRAGDHALCAAPACRCPQYRGLPPKVREARRARQVEYRKRRRAS